MGRPSKYNPETAARVCELIASNPIRLDVLLKQHDDLPDARTVWVWLAKYDEFRQMYALAREAQVEPLVEETIEISDFGKNDTYVDDEGALRVDNDVIQRSKLRVDTRKWLIEKLAPKKYGQLVKTELSNPDGSLRGMSPAQIAAKLELIGRNIDRRIAQKEERDAESFV